MTEINDSNQTQEPMGEQMTLGQTLLNIFFEPSQTFEALRFKPRFLVAMLISIFFVTAFQIALIQKIGYETIIRQQINNSPRADQMSSEQKANAIELYKTPALKLITYASPVIVFAIIFAIGGLIYWGASSAFGGSANYRQSLSLFTYSSFPMYLLTMLANIIVVFVKSADDIDIESTKRGLVQLNLGFFLDTKTSPVIGAVLSSFDVFWFFGLFLAAIGFQKIAKLSASTAWTIVFVLWIIAVAVRIVASLLF